MVDTQVEGKKSASDVPMVREFPDVFPTDLLGVLPMRKLELGST